MADYTNLDTWLATFVGSEDFMKRVESTLKEIENPSQRFKAMLDLMDYVKPKVKTIDPPSPDDKREITITYMVDGKKT